jgi:FixJ family two-component response regulator
MSSNLVYNWRSVELDVVLRANPQEPTLDSIPLIAIVDDDAPLRDAIDNLLRSLGYVSARYASAEAFLESPDAADAAVLLIDVHMPGMSGLELQRTLRKRGDTRPVIVITALLEEEVSTQALKDGALACLRKPFEDDQLVRSIELALSL